jgi:magnesium transporter
MKRSKRKRSQRALKTGAAPGTAAYAGPHREGSVVLRVHRFDPEQHHVTTPNGLSDVLTARDPRTALWIEVDGVHDAGLIEAIGRHVGASSLMIEDILHPGARPRVEVSSQTLFALLRCLQPKASGGDAPIEVESLALLRQPGLLVSFQEASGDAFAAVRTRLHEDRSLRERGVDGLLHALIDAVIDDDLAALDAMESAVDGLEDAAVLGRDPDLIQRFLRVKDDLNALRTAISPVRTAIADLKRSAAGLVHPGEVAYLADLGDHLDAATDQLDALRERASTALELHLAVLNQSMNQVIRLLTVVSTIFSPLTFIVGVYGMNFAYMPELAWPYGYPMVMVLMLVLSLGLVLAFRRWRWLSFSR